MSVGELNLKCGECPIIDYCNDYEDTPPCLQPRFEKILIKDYLNATEEIDYTGCATKNDIVNAIFRNVS